jgi:hypothetical protein
VKENPVDNHIRDNMRYALEGLIPLHIAEMRNLPINVRRDRAARDGRLLASDADKLLYAPGRRPGVLPALARGMAALAYQPGGVTAVGIHACAHPHPYCPASAARPACCPCDPRTCTADVTGGDCATPKTCAWCTSGCPAADRTAQPCCSPHPLWGRVRLLDR